MILFLSLPKRFIFLFFSHFLIDESGKAAMINRPQVAESKYKSDVSQQGKIASRIVITVNEYGLYQELLVRTY